DGLAIHPATLSGHEERHVDGFLHVAARLVDDLAHLAGHVLRELLFPLREDLGGPEQQLGPARRRHQAPALVRQARRVDRLFDVAARRFLESANQIITIGGITVFEDIPRRRRHPLTVYEVTVCRFLRSAGRHGLESTTPCRSAAYPYGNLESFVVNRM